MKSLKAEMWCRPCWDEFSRHDEAWLIEMGHGQKPRLVREIDGDELTDGSACFWPDCDEAPALWIASDEIQRT